MKFEKGDKVKLIRGEVPDDTVRWINDMPSNIGQIGEIVTTYTGNSEVYFAGKSIYFYPQNALELVKEPSIFPGNTVVFTRNITSEEVPRFYWHFNIIKDKEAVVHSIHDNFVVVVMSNTNFSYKVPINALKLKEEEKMSLYRKFQDELNIKEGDSIKITGLAVDGQFGWSGDWDYDLDEAWNNDTEGIVTAVNYGDAGFEIVLIEYLNDNEGSIENCTKYDVPFFVLEKIDQPTTLVVKLSDEYNAIIDKDKIKVGCQTIDFKSVKKVYEAMIKLGAK